MIEVELITGHEALVGLCPAWRQLWHRDPAATPFQSPAWLLSWWEVFGTAEPRLLLARSGGDLVGLLPLYLLRERGCRKLLPIGIGLSDYIEGLVDPAAADAAPLLVAAIAAMAGWDECWLPDLLPEGMLATAVMRNPMNYSISAAPPCPNLALPDDPSKLAEIVPRKVLRDVRQARRRAAAAGGATIEAVGKERLDPVMDELFGLHEQRWRVRGEYGVCSDPKVQRFHRMAARRLLAAGMLRLYRLSLGAAVLAVYYGFAAKRRAYAYLGGFDPAHSRLSPGAQIIAYAIEQAVAEGASRFDFLRGDESYKRAWGAGGGCKKSIRLSRANRPC